MSQSAESTSSTGVIFLKLGGSLVTDKTQAHTPRRPVITRLANEIHHALDIIPDMRLLVGHGSGSFGHWDAKPYDTRQGVHTPAQWRGYARVAASAARLNRIITDAFLEADVPVLSVQPSASAICHDYQLKHLDTRSIHTALARGLVPLVYGDVALDDIHGGTIISTEDIFLFLADELRLTRILLLGEVAGVLDPDGNVISRITPDDLPTLRNTLMGSAGVDVTGGMADKVTRMVQLVHRHPMIRVHICAGTEPELLSRMLTDPTLRAGTLITS
jgi:isopentenyl phosphate kinase